MKTAFNLHPEITDLQQLHMLIEAGSYGITFIWYRKDPLFISGIMSYHFENNFLPEEIAGEIEKIIVSDTIYLNGNNSTTICYDFKESLLIPESYQNHSTDEALLELVYAVSGSSIFKKDVIGEKSMFNIYAIHKKIDAVIGLHYPEANCYHSTSLQLQKQTLYECSLYCIFFHNTVKVLVYHEYDLRLVQQLNYSLPVDAAFQLLNCCEQNHMEKDQVRIVLSGMIDEKSKLYTELYRYFLHIEFENPELSVEVHERIQYYPSHFFSHLTRLITCVS